MFKGRFIYSYGKRPLAIGISHNTSIRTIQGDPIYVFTGYPAKFSSLTPGIFGGTSVVYWIGKTSDSDGGSAKIIQRSRGGIEVYPIWRRHSRTTLFGIARGGVNSAMH